jgi:hypothetical protein
MFCEAYNQSLTDAAASGEPLSPGLQRHLASCDSCRVAFAEEQSLFAAIDSGLRAAANSEVPAALIPRVHVALNNEPAPQPTLQKWIFAGTVLTCSVVMAIALQFRHREAPVPVKTAKAQTSAPTPPRPANALPMPSATREIPRQSNRAETAQASPESTDASVAAEVLVPDEERVAFAKFLASGRRLSSQSAVAVLSIPEAPKDLAPIPPVEIASLKVLPLDGEGENANKF